MSYNVEQAPTHSAVTLSSDSEPSPKGSPLSDYEPLSKGSPSRVDTVHLEEPSPRKSSEIPVNDNNQGIILGESGAGSLSNKPSKAKSTKKRVKVEDQTPRQKKNTANKKRKGGILGFLKTILCSAEC
jgi:hypothetical protein